MTIVPALPKGVPAVPVGAGEIPILRTVTASVLAHRTTAAALLEAAERVPAKIEDDAEAKSASESVRDLGRLRRDMEKERKDVTSPLTLAKRWMDDTYGGVVKVVEAAERAVKTRLGDYQMRKEAEVRRAAEEAERKRAEVEAEAEMAAGAAERSIEQATRLLQTAIRSRNDALIARARAMLDRARGAQAEAAAKVVDAAMLDAPRKEEAAAKAWSGGTVSASVRWELEEGTDLSKVPVEFLSLNLVAVNRARAAAIAAGTMRPDLIPGLTFRETRGISSR